MNLANKTFKDNRTGELVKVIDSFENIAILENKQKIDVSKLTDISLYTEQIDPSAFFNNQGAYNNLADKIKNISTENIRDEDGSQTISVNIDGNISRPATNESAVVMTTEDDERAELARKYGASNDIGSSVNKQNEAFSKILGDDSELPQPVQKTEVRVNDVQHVEVRREPVQEKRVVEDPIVTMFKNVKKGIEFKMNIEISNKIPRIDFIEMMEDSYETSIIDFLANDFTNKLLSDPDKIKSMISDRIKQLVYGEVSKKEEVKAEVKKEVKPISVKKSIVKKTRTIPVVSKKEAEKLTEDSSKK
jgi:hypothetical protein